jgi:hypothetical protein
MESSILAWDRAPVLMLLIGAFALLTSPSTSSSLLSAAISRQDKGMAKNNNKPVDQKNGHSPKPPVTPLGKELRRLREKYIASGGKLLNRRELEREVAECRGTR